MLLSLLSAALACPATVGTVVVDVGAVETAWVQLDRALLTRATAEATADAACLGEPLPAGVLARLHRAQAFAAFVAGDEDRVLAALGALKAVDAELGLPPELVSAGHPLHTLYARAEPGPTAPVPSPAGGRLVFDGRPGTARPVSRATVAWMLDRDGLVQTSAYIWPADPLFAYAVEAPAPVPGTVHPRRVPLLVGAGVGLAMSGAAGVLAATTRSAWVAVEDPETEGRLYAQNHALVGVSVGAGVLAVGAGTLAFAW